MLLSPDLHFNVTLSTSTGESLQMIGTGAEVALEMRALLGDDICNRWCSPIVVTPAQGIQ